MREFIWLLIGNAVAIFLVLLLVFNDVVATVLVMANVGCVVCAVTGSVWFWGMQFNSVTIVHLFMSVGVTVDYCAHIVHEFKSQHGEVEGKVRMS